ncbi:MAG TPA: ABC transporter permease [Anaerolineae bacterium]|nr:ABC transporter permease [Anaerolineae bacterium]
MFTQLQYDFSIAWRNITSRRLQTAVTILVIGLTISLFVTINILGDSVRRGIADASDPFGVLVVGPKGSGQQLVLSTILLQGLPVGSIDDHIYEELQADERVALAVPIAMGDNVGGARIIGTNLDFFQLSRDDDDGNTFQLAQGDFFDHDFEAVLGSSTAAALGLTLGDQFFPAHGVERAFEDDHHGEAPYTVVGILAPSNTPYDNAAFVTTDSVWQSHDGVTHDDDDDHHDDDDDHHDDDDDHHDDEEDHADEPTGPQLNALDDELTAATGRLTAILVKPASVAVTSLIWQDFYNGTEAQAAYPGQELGLIFDMMRQAERILSFIGYLAALMAGLTLLLAIYSATLAREQTIAIMRGLGASRGTIVRIILFEALLAAIMGALAGRLIGYTTGWLIATAITEQSAIAIPVRFMPELEPFLWLLPIALGILGGLIPAIFAYRVNVIDKLFPQ